MKKKDIIKKYPYILSNYKGEELLNILKDHIYSFNDINADKKIDNMINDLLIEWKNHVNKKTKKFSKKEELYELIKNKYVELIGTNDKEII